MLVNYDAEAAVIGILLSNEQAVEELKLVPEHFGTSKFGITLKAIKDCMHKGQPVELVSVVTELGEKLTMVGGLVELAKLIEDAPPTTNFPFYQDIVFNSAKARAARMYANDLANLENSSEANVKISELIAKLENLQEHGTKKKRSLADMILAVDAKIAAGRQGMTGIPTGFREMDKMTDGWQNKDLIVVGARPSVGKTAFAVNMADNMLRHTNDVCVHIFSLEMPDEKILERLYSKHAMIDAQRLRTLQLNDSDLEKYGQATAFYGGMVDRLHIHDQFGMTPQEIRVEVRKVQRKFPEFRHIVIIDYLTIMGYQGDKDRPDLQVTENTESLKQMAKELNLPVIVLAQLSRGVEGRQDKRPKPSDLRESGGIEQIADVIAMLYRDDYYDRETENKNIIEIIFGKHRNGPCGTVELAFVKEFGLFANLERRSDAS
ncbi:replicative DNA helicase [Bacillus phage vB_BceS-M2]